MDAWSLLQKYAKSAEQLAWLQQELAAHPLLQGQHADDWLLWRTRVAEGMSEMEAWQSVQQDSMIASSTSGGVISTPQAQSEPYAHSDYFDAQYADFTAPQAPPFGFVNMNHIAPNRNVPGVSNNGHGIVGDTIMYPQMENLSQAQNMAGASDLGSAQMDPVGMLPNFIHANYTQPSKPAPISPPISLPATISNGTSLTAASSHSDMFPPLSPFSNLGSSIAAGPSRSSSQLRVIPATNTKSTSVLPIPADLDPSKIASLPLTNEIDSSSISRVKSTPASKALVNANKPALLPKRMADIYPLIAGDVIQRNDPTSLFKLLRTRETKDGPKPPLFTPNPRELSEILNAFKRYASASYLRAMADEYRHTGVIIKWLKALQKEPNEWESAIGPLIWVLSRTDMPVNYIRNRKVGRLVKMLAEKSEEKRLSSNDDIQKAYQKYIVWCRDVLFPKNREMESDSESDGDTPIGSKRKPVQLTEGSARKRQDVKPDVVPSSQSDLKPSIVGKSATTPAPPQRSAAAVNSASKPPINKAGTAKNPGAKTDMSFFSGPPTAATPKPKPKLPDFKRTSATTSTGSAGTSLLSATLKMLKKDDSPVPQAVSGPLNTVSTAALQADVKQGKVNKKGFTVRWVDSMAQPPRPFLQIKEFKEAPHELERAPWQVEGDVHGMSTHQLDMQEGRAMRIHEGLEEVIDWLSPPAYYEPEEQYGPTPEALEQEERERTTLATTYLVGTIPPTPDGSGARVVQQSHDTRQMSFYAEPVPISPAIAPPAPSVSDLLRNLNHLIPVPAPPPPLQYTPQYTRPYQPPPPQHDYQPAIGWQSSQPSTYAQQGWSGHDAPAGSSLSASKNYGYVGVEATGHSKSTMKPHQPFRTRMCKYFREGSCRAGEDCTFLHV